jgi:ketosteroid isomerase-like protein
MTDKASIVVDFFNAANREGMDALRRFASTDMRFWAPGVGEISLEQYLAIVQSIVPLLKTPLSFKVHDVIRDGDRLGAEVESHAQLKNGKVYNNKYHFKILLSGDKISEIREYADTKHLAETFDLYDLGASRLEA